MLLAPTANNTRASFLVHQVPRTMSSIFVSKQVPRYKILRSNKHYTKSCSTKVIVQFHACTIHCLHIMQVFSNIGRCIKCSSSIFLQPITPLLGNVLHSGRPKAVLVRLLTLVMINKEHDARLRPILQTTVHSQIIRNGVSLLDVHWDWVSIQCVLTDGVVLAFSWEPLLPLNLNCFSFRLQMQCLTFQSTIRHGSFEIFESILSIANSLSCFSIAVAIHSRISACMFALYTATHQWKRRKQHGNCSSCGLQLDMCQCGILNPIISITIKRLSQRVVTPVLELIVLNIEYTNHQSSFEFRSEELAHTLVCRQMSVLLYLT